jgi:hypothetical protein
MSEDYVDARGEKGNSQGSERRGFHYRPRSAAEWEARCNQLDDDDDEAEPRETSGAEGEGDQAVAFLAAWRPGGPWLLTAIDPDGGAPIETCEFTRAGSAQRWIDGRNGTRNIYFSPNRTRPGLARKARKEDIAAAEAAYVDIDPAKTADGERALELEQGDILDRLKGFALRPSAIVFSGGGLQGYWRYEAPVPIGGSEDVARLEAVNRDLREALGGDATHDVSRILRLPGTWNLPDRKKREAGRVPTLAEVIHFDPGLRYRFEELAEAAREASKASGAPDPESGDAEAAAPADRGDDSDALPVIDEELHQIIKLGY